MSIISVEGGIVDYGAFIFEILSDDAIGYAFEKVSFVFYDYDIISFFDAVMYSL